MFIFERLCSIIFPEEADTGEFYLREPNIMFKSLTGGVWHSGNALAYSSRDRAIKTAPMLGPLTHSPYAYPLIGSREAFICGVP